MVKAPSRLKAPEVGKLQFGPGGCLQSNRRRTTSITGGEYSHNHMRRIKPMRWYDLGVNLGKPGGHDNGWRKKELGIPREVTIVSIAGKSDEAVD